LTAASCLVAGLVLAAILTSLCGFGLFFFRVVWPMIPERFIPNPEKYQGVGDPLPTLELEPLTGRSSRVSLADLQNQVVLLNFWGTWCPPCRDELPHLAGLRQRFSGQKAFRLLSVSYPVMGQGDDLQSLRENTETLLKRLGVDMPVYWDPDDATRTALNQVVPDAMDAGSGISLFPTTVLLDRHGLIRAVWIGYRPGVETEMERYVDQVLSEEER
jgi:thiol-disulfide isomerase/thioredoxin